MPIVKASHTPHSAVRHVIPLARNRYNSLSLCLSAYLFILPTSCCSDTCVALKWPQSNRTPLAHPLPTRRSR